MTVTPAARAAATTSWVLASISVRSITSETAPWSTPPSDVKSFWYSIRTTAVVLGSTAMSSLLKVGACVQRLCLLVGEQHPDQESVALRGFQRESCTSSRHHVDGQLRARPVHELRAGHPHPDAPRVLASRQWCDAPMLRQAAVAVFSRSR